MQGCIIKRPGKNGVSWRLKFDIKDPATGERRQSYETVRGTKRDAEARLAEILSQVHKEDFSQTAKTISLRAHVETWLAKKSNSTRIEKRTPKRYAELLGHHVIPYLGGVTLAEIQRKPDILEAHYNFLRREGKRPAHKAWKDPEAHADEQVEKQGLSEKSVLHVHRVLSQALKYAVKENILVKNPCSLIEAPRSKNHTSGDGRAEKMTILDRAELTTLLRGLRGHKLHGIALFAAGTGARRGEILALKWDDLDLEKATVRINKSLEESKEGLRVKAPKTSHSRRTIGIDSGLVSYLRAYWREQAESALKLGVRLSKEALVFPNSPVEPTAWTRPDYVTKAFPKEAERLGFPGMRFHDLRHCHVVQLLVDGAPLKAVSARVGHASAKMTLDTYDHVLPRAEQRVVEIAGSILAAALAD